MSAIKQLDDSNFDQTVLQSKGLVLVDFGATWCAPCKQQLPILEQFAAQNSEVQVFTVDVDEAPETVAAFGIRSVPTLMLFNDGMKAQFMAGLHNLAELKKFVGQQD